MAQELADYPAMIWVKTDSDTIKTQTYYGDLMLWGLPPGIHDITFNFREVSGLDDLIIPESGSGSRGEGRHWSAKFRLIIKQNHPY